jgi:hypothetical protein
MNAASLDKRLRQLERKVPDLPCPIPEHKTAFLFIQGMSDERDAANDALIASIDACARCQGKQKIMIMHMGRLDKPEPPKQEAPFGIHILKIGDGDE